VKRQKATIGSDSNLPPSPVRIILVIGDLTTAAAGPNALVRRLAAWLVSHGYDVTVVGTFRGQRPMVTELASLHGQARIAMHKRYFKDSWHFSPGCLWFALRLVFSRIPFVVEMHSPWLFNGIALSLAAKLKRQNVFVKLAGNLRPLALKKNRTLKRLAMRFFFRHWFSCFTGVIALNETELSDALRVLPEAFLYEIPNGVEPHPLALKSQRNREVLFLGRIDPIKNLEHLIDAFYLVSKEFTGWRLRIVGPATDPLYLETLRARPAVSALNSRIVFQGAAYGTEKESRLLSAALFVLTSWSEGQPNAVLEAMAHGLPVIVSDQCNINIPPNCGRTCSCMTEDIAEALGELLTLSEDQRRYMGELALDLVRKEFDADAAFTKRLSLYMSEVPS
jgi:glycosyltransferase involved in cell wall biosynthesis